MAGPPAASYTGRMSDTEPASGGQASGGAVAAPAGHAVALPHCPILVPTVAGALWVSQDGEMETVTGEAAAARIAAGAMPLLCHRRAVARRLGLAPAFAAFDVLELFAFVRPAQFCVPTPGGLARALRLPAARGAAGDASALRDGTLRLLQDLSAVHDKDRAQHTEARAIATLMARGGWPWAEAALAALGPVGRPASAGTAERGPPESSDGIAVWRRLPRWQDLPPPPPPSQHAVSPAEARGRLALLLGPGAEDRPQQADYASAVSLAFAAPERSEAPHMVLAEAGTGIGKTLGYVAPASVWAEKNEGTVWISTFTRNLQHQIDSELERLFPDRTEKAARVVLRKGRENYLCLLNLEDAARGATNGPGDVVAVGLMLRWAGQTRHGDMVGGDFPSWLPGLAGARRTRGLSDHRGECIHSACPHYQTCFIERSVQDARHARLVVTNHALALTQAALAAPGESRLPTRYVLDEGHHLFDAADSVFSAVLSGQEAAELRLWVSGGDAASRAVRGRLRGLSRRLGDLLAGDEAGTAALDACQRAALALPGTGWHGRLRDGATGTRASGAIEAFLGEARRLVYARSGERDSPYGLECDPAPADEPLLTAAARAAAALGELAAPMRQLAARLEHKLESEADQLGSDGRQRIEAAIFGLRRRADGQLAAWTAMLRGLGGEPPDAYCDWFAIDRFDGRDIDVGFHRHWIDPTEPLAETLAGHAHGIVVTSATLTDGGDDVEADWQAAEARTGASHMPAPALRVSVASPFDYSRQARVFVATDVARDTPAAVAGAYRALFEASAGGALGLFTAISRLRAVHDTIAAPLEAAGLPLHAQHLDGLDTTTLVDIFRAEPDACLLGTDALRDGVDVPGDSLRLIVFDRVPWPRPTLLHKARRKAFGPGYDDRIVRLRLKQAFGRLVRRADDMGVFVLLDSRMPTRLLGAFPEGVPIERLPLQEVVAATRRFLAGV